MTTPNVVAKGSRGGECNRTVCSNGDAQWFNRSTRKYYCVQCAIVLNVVNASESMGLFGGPLCVRTEAPNASA